MSIKRLLIGAVAAGLIVGSAPVGGVASASCASPVQLFFYAGVTVAGEDISNPIAINSGTAGCFIGEEAGLVVDAFYVYPGSTFVAGRDNNAVCVNIFGTITGLGVNDGRVWTPPVDPIDGSCNATVGTNGAGTDLIPMDPTALGTITATTANGSIVHRTIDR